MEVSKLYSYLSSVVPPRYTELVSTIDKNGSPNLSLFSIFNVFSENPLILMFSLLQRM